MQYMKIYLNVPFKEKEEAKKLGAKWDNIKESWYCTISPEESCKFEKWIPNNNIVLINSENELENFISQLDNPDFNITKGKAIHIHNMPCPKCKKGYIVVKNRKDGIIFAGCSCYKDNKNPCTNSLNINDFRDLALSKLTSKIRNKFIPSNPITSYFTNALSVRKQPVIDFKTTKFVIEPNTHNIENGYLNPIATKELFEKKEKKTLNVIIALKTLSTVFDNAFYIDENAENNELTSILFLPAVLSSDGKLDRAENEKLPWIPRNYLSPMIDAAISIGTETDYDEFLGTSTSERNNIGDDWKKFINYAKNMYYSVTKNPYENNFIKSNSQNLKLENQYYVFEDKSVNATKNILDLYTYLANHPENKLYQTITNINPTPSKQPFRVDDVSQMMKHSGQMGGEYPLSYSQREAIHTFAELKEGEVLAVSGPPGTGKTTLLQSVVATMLVEHALQQQRAPIIIASSTNNQAVTNIISSFEKINTLGIKNLEKRWICGVKNFATYFPSKREQKKLENADEDCQWTNNLGDNFFQNVETEENRTDSKTLFFQEFNTFFHSQCSTHDFSSAKSCLAKELKNIDTTRKTILLNLNNLKQGLNKENYNHYSKYILNLDSQINKLQSTISKHNNEIKALEEKKRDYFTRIKEWSASYDSLPILLKFFSFLPFCKKKLSTWFTSFQQENELNILTSYMPIEKIQETYHTLIEKTERTISNIKSLSENEKVKIQSIESKKLDIQTKYHELIKLFDFFKKYGIFTKPQDYETDLDQLEINKLNDLFDCKIRYIEFWLAIHYYEAVWLGEELNREDAIIDSPTKLTKKSLTILFERIAMLSPCMVMTFFMLPKQFHFQANKLNHYMINYIDLLIVDEAGQTSPEIAAASFSLAKKAIVVGDEKQIPPVWGTEEILDKTMAVKNKVIRTEDDFTLLKENGLNCSQSSIMKVAAMSCIYEKFEKGLFLSEHRRCYDEIVKYCNELIYAGRLEPMRGSFQNDNNPLIGYLPPMGHKEIRVSHSKKMGVSRCNETEAQQIVLWLQENYPIIIKKYENTNSSEILGIITPFKPQKTLIKKELHKKLPEYEDTISVGTVHSFQGAEYKIIIFSSVYGNQDGCSFINQTASLMNVAVSRAKDSFLVFGDSGCLIGGSSEAGPMLKKATIESI